MVAKAKQMKQAKLVPLPISVTKATAFVGKYHRHNRPPRFFNVAIGVSDGNKLVGVAIVGPPVSRILDDGKTMEVRRVCTDGTPNACSFLYGRCIRIAKQLGMSSLVTYTLASESGASLRAVGAKESGRTGQRRSPKRQWANRKGRIVEPVVASVKIRWELLPTAAVSV